MLLETLSVKLVGDVSDFANKMGTAGNAITAIGDKMQAVGQRMQSIGQQWSLYISAPLIALGKTALDSAADFEQSMNVMQQVTGATGDQMATLSKQALQLGKDTVFGAGEAADAQLALAKAGFEVQQVLDATPGVINMAAAADMGLAEAADVAASAINAFRLEAKDANRISDLLAAAANNSTAEVHDMALALKMSSAVMAQYGFTAEETVTVLSQMANAGIKNSDAGTSLKVAMMRLAAPTAVAAGTMAQYGIQIYDAAGNMKNMREIITEFDRALGPHAIVTREVGGATEEMAKAAKSAAKSAEPLSNRIQEQQAKLAILNRELAGIIEKYGEGSTQAANKQLAILKLTNQLEESQQKYANATQAIDDYRSAEAAATTVTAALTEQQRNAALETIFGTDAIRTMNILMAEGVDSYDAMMAAVTEGGAAQEVANARMKGLAGAVEYFKGTLDSLMIETALPWLNQIDDMIRGTADWIAKFGELDPAVQKNIVVMAALVAAVGPVLLYAGLLTQAIGAITSALGAMSVFIYANPIVALVALGAAMTAFAVAWANDWAGARDAAQVAFDYFQARWPELAEVTRDNATKIAGSINNIIGSLRDLFTYSRTTGPQITSAWGGIFGGIYTVTLRTVTAVTKSIELLLNAITAIQRAMDALTSGDWSGLATIKTDFDTLMRGMQGTLIEDLAKWMDPLYWIGLRPDLPTAAANTPLADILRERGLAGGGMVPTAGRYLVGELGPEMVTLPAGAYVHSNRETSKMGSGITITLNQMFSGNVDKNAVASGAQQGILAGLRQVGLA